MMTSSQELPRAYKQAISRLLWRAASVSIYVKILGIGLVIATFFAGIASHEIWGLVLCVAASLFSTLAVTYMLNRPIRALLNATNRVREGDFTARAPVYSDDEIGRLAVAFNRMAEGLAESKQRLLRADRLATIGEFAAGIAHEINNPLDGVMSCLARLQRDPANLAQNMEYMQMIQHALKRVSTVIQRLLEYSQTREIHFEPEDVHVVIENVVALVRVMAQQGNVDIEYEFGEDVPLVAGDRYYLEQALLNLALNALAATPQGGTITFRTRVNEGTSSEGRRVEVDVVDTGTGIEPENLPRVFDPFFTTKEPGRGTGLGLAIVKEIIESHGGTITVESVPGGGAMARVLLPAGDASGAGRSLLEKVSLR